MNEEMILDFDEAGQDLGRDNLELVLFHETATSSQAAHREVGVYILYTVLETIVEGFQEHLQTFFKQAR
jgi:hypothetical protein